MEFVRRRVNKFVESQLVPIYLPASAGSTIDKLTPREIVVELDRHVIGQNKAKRAVAVALRNRLRRQKLPAELAEEVAPKNILMFGPTGVGKTEIARGLALLTQSPFVKVEASKFTEVGYVGRDVEQIIRDLLEIAIAIEKEKHSVNPEPLDQSTIIGQSKADSHLDNIRSSAEFQQLINSE